MKNRIIAYLLVILAGLLPIAPATAQDDVDHVSVAIAQRGLWDTLVIHQGIEEGFFADESLAVDVTWTKGGTETVQAVTTRSADMGFAAGVTGVLGAYQRGAPVRIIGAEMTGADDLFWYARADSGLESLADAAGKRIGYSRPGSSSNLVLLDLLKNAGVKANVIAAGGISDNRVQVMTGQLDVGWSGPPFNLDLVKEGKLRIIAKGSDLPALSEQTVRVNISNATFLNRRRDVAKRFMRAYMRTVDWMYNNRDEAIERFAEFNDIELPIARNAAEFYPKETLLSVPVKGMERSMQQAREHGALKKPLSEKEIDELVDYVYDPR